MSSSAAAPGKQDGANDGDDANWTCVHRRRKGKNVEGRPPPNPEASTSAQQDLSNKLSPDEIRTAYESVGQQWRSSPSYQELTKLIEDNAATHATINKAVCLGNGSFDPPDGIRDRVWAAHLQTQAFMHIVDILNKQRDRPIECFFQEPAYGEADKAFIESLGATVVETPAAFEMTDPFTFIFGVHLYKEHAAAPLQNELPGLFVGTDAEGWDKVFNFYYRTSMRHIWRLEKLEAIGSKFTMPCDRGDYTFNHTSIMWTKRSHQHCERCHHVTQNLRESGVVGPGLADLDPFKNYTVEQIPDMDVWSLRGPQQEPFDPSLYFPPSGHPRHRPLSPSSSQDSSSDN